MTLFFYFLFFKFEQFQVIVNYTNLEKWATSYFDSKLVTAVYFWGVSNTYLSWFRKDSCRQGPLQGGRRLCEGSDENLSTNICYFVAMLRFVAIYALFGRLWARKRLFEPKTVFLGHDNMVYVAFYTD